MSEEETDPNIDHRCMSLETALDIADAARWDDKIGRPVFDCKPEEHYQAFKKLSELVKDFIRDDRDPQVVEANFARTRRILRDHARQ
jgi:hypothetical protein